MYSLYKMVSHAVCTGCALVLLGCGGGGGSSTSSTAPPSTPSTPSTPPSTPGVADTTAPTVPAGLVAISAGATQINLSWGASTDGVGVTAYRVYRNGALIATPGNVTSYGDVGLAASTAYSYTVEACDAASNCSMQSSTTSATTSSATASDTTAPTVPAGLVATPVSATRIDLSWTASTDNVGVTGYMVYRNGALIANLGNVTSYSDTGLSNLTAYSYTLSACDAASNCSAQSSAVSPVYPSSGTYAVALRAQGTVSNPMLGISLVHPARTGVEFVIESSAVAVADVRTVLSGTVNVSAQTVSNVTPQSLLYIVAGDVRRVPLMADGTAPATRLRKAGSSVACQFTVVANNYAAPDSSRYIVSTSGADGTCGTGDDGQAMVTLDASGGVNLTQLDTSLNGAVLGMVRNPATQTPAGWVYRNEVDFWDSAPAVMRQNADPLITRVVVSTSKSVVVEDHNRLTIWDIGSNQSVSETKLDATLTAGTGWQMAGFDADNYYVYLNSGNTLSTVTWKILKINRATHAVTPLTNDTGYLILASMGSSLLYVTVTDPSHSPVLSNRLLSINKTTGFVQALKSTIITTAYTVLTSANGVHAMVQGSYNATTKTVTAGSLSMIDEQGTQLYSAGNGVPLMQPDSATSSFNSSVNSSRFIIVTGYSVSRMFGDATLLVYDAATRSATTLGILPGTSAFGSDPVLAAVTGASTNFMAGIAGRVVSQSLQDADEKVFSFDTSVASSLQYTVSKQ